MCGRFQAPSRWHQKHVFCHFLGFLKKCKIIRRKKKDADHAASHSCVRSPEIVKKQYFNNCCEVHHVATCCLFHAFGSAELQAVSDVEAKSSNLDQNTDTFYIQLLQDGCNYAKCKRNKVFNALFHTLWHKLRHSTICTSCKRVAGKAEAWNAHTECHIRTCASTDAASDHQWAKLWMGSGQHEVQYHNEWKEMQIIDAQTNLELWRRIFRYFSSADSHPRDAQQYQPMDRLQQGSMHWPEGRRQELILQAYIQLQRSQLTCLGWLRKISDWRRPPRCSLTDLHTLHKSWFFSWIKKVAFPQSGHLEKAVCVLHVLGRRAHCSTRTTI